MTRIVAWTVPMILLVACASVAAGSLDPAPRLSPASQALDGSNGATLAFHVDVTNNASVATSMALDATAPDGWSASFDPYQTTFAAGETRTVTGHVSGPDTSKATITLQATDRFGNGTARLSVCFHDASAPCDAPKPSWSPREQNVSGNVSASLAFEVNLTNPANLTQKIRVDVTHSGNASVSLDAYDDSFGPGETRVLHGHITLASAGRDNVTLTARGATGSATALVHACANDDATQCAPPSALLVVGIPGGGVLRI